MEPTMSSYNGVVHSLLREHGSKIVGVALFGSTARGEGKERSDLDFLVVVREWPWSLERRRLLYKPIYDAVNRDAERIRDATVIDVDEKDIMTEELEVTPLLLNIAWESKVLYDPEGKLAKFVGRVKELIDAAGLERYRTGEGKYGWKPRSGLLRKVEV